MSFSAGFLKCAAFGHNNQGLEFKETDTSQPPTVGPGGMSPSGIPTYQPVEHAKDTPLKSVGKKKGLHITEAARLMVEKLSQVGGRAGIAGTTATQLKYETSAPWSHEGVGSQDQDAQERAKKYEKARKR